MSKQRYISFLNFFLWLFFLFKYILSVRMYHSIPTHLSVKPYLGFISYPIQLPNSKCTGYKEEQNSPLSSYVQFWLLCLLTLFLEHFLYFLVNIGIQLKGCLLYSTQLSKLLGHFQAFQVIIFPKWELSFLSA